MNREVDIVNLSRDDLEVEYKYLQEKCRQLLDASENDAQRIHELTRNLETANAAEQYLAQELEQLTAATVNSNTDESNHKLQMEHDELRRKYKLLEEELMRVQEEYDALVVDHSELGRKVEQLSTESKKNDKVEAQVDYDKLNERLLVLEQDNMELLHKFEEQRVEAVKQSMILAEKEKRIEVVQDELMCFQENLRYKREELEEKSNLLESAQEQLCEANAKINMLMSAPENKERKGNSLFAEVDDQRQVMKKLLASQKKSYNDMKKIYNDSQYEIRRLQRENSAMHTELQACSSIFRNADRTYQEKLISRISYILNENEDLEKKLKRSQDHLKELANNHGVSWVDSMLEFCKKETTELKSQLYSIRIQNASLEEQVRNLQQDLARWRFESLKSRCLLIDRENLLNDHKIAFKPQMSVEYDIKDEKLQKARPRIVPVEYINPNQAIELDETASKEKLNLSSAKMVDPKLEQSLNSTSKSVITINDSIERNDKENDCSSTMANSVVSCKVSPVSLKSNLHLPSSCVISPTLQTKSVETISKESQQVKIEDKDTLPSILCKKRDFITENEKKVQFAVNKPTVHNLSASLDASGIDVTSENAMDVEKNAIEDKINTALATIQTIRTKSNVLVRRIVVKSKPK